MPTPTFPVSALTYKVLVFIAKLPPVVFDHYTLLSYLAYTPCPCDSDDGDEESDTDDEERLDTEDDDEEESEEDDEEEDDEEKITIGDDVKLELTDINNLTNPSIKVNDPILDDIEVLG